MGKAVASDSASLPSGYARWYLGSSGHAMLGPQKVATLLVDLALEAEMKEAVDISATTNESKISCRPDVAPSPKKSSRTPDPFHVDTERLDDLSEQGAPPAAATHRVWDVGAVRERIELHNGHSTGDRESRERDAAVFRAMVERGPDLPVRRVEASALAAVYEDYGHMHRVLDAIRADVLVTGTLRPLLIAGPPGVGKTHFVRTMAEALGLEFEMLDAATGINATSLVGLQRTWANSEIGMVFRHLCQRGESANPVFVVDEVDKATDSVGRYRLVDALLPLLEARTARCMRDLSADLEIDASRISWIALTNSLRGLSGPLLSRFQLVTPSEPTPAQRFHVAKRIAAQVAKAADLRRVDRDIVVALADRTPREILHALQAAANRAVAAGRTAMRPSDVVELGVADQRWH